MVEGVEPFRPELKLTAFPKQAERLAKRHIPVVDAWANEVVAALVAAMGGEVGDSLRIIRRVWGRFHVAVSVELAGEGAIPGRKVAVTGAIRNIAHEVVGTGVTVPDGGRRP